MECGSGEESLNAESLCDRCAEYRRVVAANTELVAVCQHLIDEIGHDDWDGQTIREIAATASALLTKMGVLDVG
jgi:hypothetical protein